MHRNGCWGRPPFPALIPIPAVYRISIEGHQVDAVAHEMSAYPFAMECQYTKTDLGQSDKGCIDCTHRESK